jgi:hypothetical protein
MARKHSTMVLREAAEPLPLTLSVPDAGRRYFGMSKNASYDAAARGEIPTVRIGRLLRVPVRAMEAILDRVSHTASESEA